MLSFTRTVQRLFEQAWELPPLSVRNSLNGLKWIGGLLVYSAITGAIRGLIDNGPLEIASALVLLPLSAAFLVWSGYMLSAKRIAWRDLVPFGVVARRAARASTRSARRSTCRTCSRPTRTATA